MATNKKKPADKKTNLIQSLIGLSNEDKLDVISRALGVSVDTDNYGQIVIYTNLMHAGYENGDDGIVPFEVDCLKDHVEDEEEHECEF